VRRQGKK